MKCEYCNKEHNGSFATGRFCNRSCSNGFSTKAKRKEINEKVSKTLTQHKQIERNCLVCNKKFITTDYNGPTQTQQKLCSRECGSQYWPDSRRKSQSLAMVKRILNGHAPSLKSIRCEYLYKDKLIKCDSKVEYSCLDYFENEFNVMDIDRCNFSLPFEFENRERRYIPDFKIKTTNGEIYIVECKTIISNNDLQRKWKYYYDTIDIKRETLINYCDKNGYTPFFYNKELNRKFYDNCNPTGIPSV